MILERIIKKNTIWESYYNKIDFKVKYINKSKRFFNEITCKKLKYLIQYTEENYSPTVMFRGTPCIKLDQSEWRIRSKKNLNCSHRLMIELSLVGIR